MNSSTASSPPGRSGNRAARRDKWFFLCAAAAILFFQLILPPVVGLADNGDFPKVLGRFDLYPRVERVYEYASTVYDFQPERHWTSQFYSTEIPLAVSAILLNSLFSKDGSFDLRFIGIVHGALFLTALWFFAPLLADARRWVRLVLYALVLLVYCDVMYVSGLNSFYMDESAYLFLLLSAVFYLRVLRWHRRSDAAWLMVCPLLLTASKAPHAPIGIWIAVLLIIARKSLWPAAKRRFAVAGAVVALVSGLMLWKGSPPEYASYSLFNAVFIQIVPDSKDAGRTLADLGLDDSYRSCIGKGTFTPDSGMADEAFRKAFEERVSLPKLAVFYATHPRDMYRALRDSLSVAGNQRSMGNFDMSTGFRPGTESRAFASWSNFKRRLFFSHGPRFLFAFLGMAAVLSGLLWLWRRRLPSGTMAGGLVLIGMALTELAISSLADALDIERHHLIFFALFDMLVLGVIGVVLGQTGNRRPRIPDAPSGR